MSIRSDNADDAKRSVEGRAGLFDRLRALLGLAPASVREDIEEALDEAAGDVTPHERALLKNVLGLHDLRVEDAMIPRADIIAIGHDATVRDACASSARPDIRACRSMPIHSTIRAGCSIFATSSI